jgi:hypothetical protein
VLRAMAFSLLVGIPIGAASPDAVTPLVAGLAAGGLAALRHDPLQSWKPRVIAAFAATVFVFLLLIVSDLALVVAPALPFTSIGVADELAERRERPATPDG